MHMTDASAIMPGMDLFAATWLERWTQLGGYVVLGADGQDSFGHPMYHDSPAYVASPPDWSEERRRDREQWDDAHYHGRMRELAAVLDAFPAGRAAVKSHMRAHGMSYYMRSVPKVAVS